MANFVTLQKMALSLPETTEEPHFERTSFRVGGKIFVTYDNKSELACIMFSEIDQNVFCLNSAGNIYPVPNKWGTKGATYFVISKIKTELLNDAVTTAYCKVAPKRLSKPYTDRLNQLAE